MPTSVEEPVLNKPKYVVCLCKTPPTLHYKQVFKTRLALPGSKTGMRCREIIDNRTAPGS